jgi:hypothetical protein
MEIGKHVAGLTLLSDLSLQTGNTLYTGVLNLNGHCLHNAAFDKRAFEWRCGSGYLQSGYCG